MDDKERLQVLENALAQMLKPVKGIPLNVIIKSLSERTVIKFDRDNPSDQQVLKQLERAIRLCADEVKGNPIVRPRPNEVGNDIEKYVFRSLREVGLKPSAPTSTGGHAKSTGYPDILFHDEEGRPTYLECKIFTHGTDPSTMRSFYLSPSESFKVSLDARHLLLAYGMQAEAIPNSRNSLYRPSSYKLVDLHDLLCDVKYEFNSDNRRLYNNQLMLLEGIV